MWYDIFIQKRVRPYNYIVLKTSDFKEKLLAHDIFTCCRIYIFKRVCVYKALFVGKCTEKLLCIDTAFLSKCRQVKCFMMDTHDLVM